MEQGRVFRRHTILLDLFCLSVSLSPPPLPPSLPPPPPPLCFNQGSFRTAAEGGRGREEAPPRVRFRKRECLWSE
jgi:hypothetical protein